LVCWSGRSGQYILNGRDVGSLHEDARATMRSREIGLCFNFPRSFRAAARWTTRSFRSAMPASVHRSDIAGRRSIGACRTGARRDHWPHQLSGGEQQRVAIARAIVNNPALILADEPTGALDSKTSEEILSLFKDLHRDGRTIVVVTHAMDVAECAQRRVTIHDGRITHDDGRHPGFQAAALIRRVP
jgi:putative ABC transport system ATP-binding protein